MSVPPALPTPAEIHATHQVVEDRYQLKYRGIRDRFPDRKLEMVLDSARELSSEWERAAALLKGIKRIHVYQDGNKRTAWLTAAEYLDRSGLEPAPSGKEVAVVMKRVDRFDHFEIAVWLETGLVDETKLP